MHKFFLLRVFSVALLFSCGKEVAQLAPAPSNPASPVMPLISPSVYVSGDSLEARASVPYPIYWKNGRMVHLLHPVPSSATGIAILDTHVYVTSSRSFLGSDVTYWKNSIGVNLVEPSLIYPTATGITVSGKDVYIVGTASINTFEKKIPFYWKNEEKAVKIPTVDFSSGESTGIAVSGNNIYISGKAWDPMAGYGRSSACYWKNNTPTFLHSPTTIYTDGIANAIAVSGTDVHVVGNITYANFAPPLVKATYWKNGQATELTTGFERSIANDIAVIGDDVYIAGGILGPNNLPRAAYWKNGVVTRIETTYSVANAITVYNNDVYIAGNRGSDVALYWKNSQPVILGKGRATDIVVVK